MRRILGASVTAVREWRVTPPAHAPCGVTSALGEKCGDGPRAAIVCAECIRNADSSASDAWVFPNRTGEEIVMKSRISMLLMFSMIAASWSAFAAKDYELTPMPGHTGPRKADIVAQQPAVEGVRQWEYLRVIQVGDFSVKEQKTRFYLYVNGQHWRHDEALDYLGKMGWQLVSVEDDEYIFQRELPKN
jgi:hypothetical protein